MIETHKERNNITQYKQQLDNIINPPPGGLLGNITPTIEEQLKCTIYTIQDYMDVFNRQLFDVDAHISLKGEVKALKFRVDMLEQRLQSKKSLYTFWNCMTIGSINNILKTQITNILDNTSKFFTIHASFGYIIITISTVIFTILGILIKFKLITS